MFQRKSHWTDAVRWEIIFYTNARVGEFAN